MSAEAELREELLRLRTSCARKLRETIEGEATLTPAWLEAARKFLADHEAALREPKPWEKQRAPATRDLPFSAGDEE